MTVVNFLAYVKRVLKRTDKDVEILEAENETLSDIASRHDFEAYMFQSWVPCVVKQEDYPLPTDLLHLQHPIRLLEGTGTNDKGWNLKWLTKAEYDAKEPNPHRTSPSDSEPSCYTVYSDSILLYPIPDSTDYLIEINWGKVPTTLSGDSDTSSFKAVWDEVVKHGTLFRMFASLELYQEAEYWRALYEQGIAKMIDRDMDKKRSHIGKVNTNTL